MSTILPVFYLVLLFGSVFTGLILLAVGIILLFKMKNKLVGGITSAVGAVFTLIPVLILMALLVTPRVQG